jgi:hypothetical protein
MVKNKICELFNKVYLTILKDIKSKNGDIKSDIKLNYKIFDKQSIEYVVYFEKQMTPDVIELLYSSGDIFQSDIVMNIEIFLNVSIGRIINDVIKDDPHEMKTFTYYVYTLMLMCHLYNLDIVDEKKQILLSSVLSIVTSVDNTELSGDDFDNVCAEIMDDDIMSILRKIYDNRTTVVILDSDFTDVPELNFLNNTKIGELVKEISKDIDLTKLNISDNKEFQIDDIGKMLSSPDNMGVLSDIMQNVSAKFTEKLKSGDINNEELMSEAMGMMGNLCGMGVGNGFGENGDMSKMMDMMSMMNNNMNNKMNNKMNNGQSPNIKPNPTLARLQKKLKTKK